MATTITILKTSPTSSIDDVEDLLTSRLLTVEEYKALIKTKFGDTLPAQFPAEVRPSLIIAYLRQEICACWSNNLMSPVTVVHLDRLLNRLSAQIFTPSQIPFLYTNYMRVLLCFYMAVTPFAIAAKYGWITPIATMIAGMALLGADEITTVRPNPPSPPPAPHTHTRTHACTPRPLRSPSVQPSQACRFNLDLRL